MLGRVTARTSRTVQKYQEANFLKKSLISPGLTLYDPNLDVESESAARFVHAIRYLELCAQTRITSLGPLVTNPSRPGKTDPGFELTV